MRHLLPLSLLVLAALAVPVLAAHERTGTLAAATPVFAWDGGPKSGGGQGESVPLAAARCTPAYQCEDTLLEVKEAGSLTIEIKAGSGSNDLDIRLYKSDESGAAPGNPNTAGAPGQPPADNPITEDISDNADAKVTVKSIKPGFYVAQVAFYSATGGTYKGTATLAPFSTAPAVTPPAATPTPTPTPAPAKKAKKKKVTKKSCLKKAKKIKNRKKRARAQKKCKKIKSKKR